MLEPDEGKLSSPVLRGLAPSNGGWPLGLSVIIIAFILILWGSGSPLLNTDPDKSLFRERASHAVRLFLSHFAVILATQIWTGLPPARNRSRAVVRDVCAIRSLRTAGGASRLMTRLTIGSKFAEACVSPAI